MADFGNMAEALIAGKIDEIGKMVQDAVDEGLSAQEILSNGLLAGMGVIGVKFKSGEMFMPEVLRSAKAMHTGMDILRPLLSETDVQGVGTFVIGTVKGDLHDIGKNLVAMMFEGAGFKVVNLGVNLEPQVFVDAVKEHKPAVLGLSALLTTTMPMMGATINALKEAGLRDSVKVMVGGAPVTAEYAKDVGADSYADNAAGSVDEAKILMAL